MDKIMSLVQGTAEKAQLVENSSMRMLMGVVIAAFRMQRVSRT